MKPLCSFLLAAPLLLGSGVLAAPTTLSPSPAGVTIRAGDLGEWTLGAPRLKNDKGDDVPLVSSTVTDARTVSYKFFDDSVISVVTDADARTVSVDISKRSPSARYVLFFSDVPFALREGGAASFDGASTPFPHDLKGGPDGSNIWRGEASRFEMRTARGQVLSVSAPRNWQQLQDNRFWNNNTTFTWMYQFDTARDPGQKSFAFRFEDVAAGESGPALPPQLVDPFGQAKRVAFPGKVSSETELKADVARDRAFYAGFKAPARDAYGGLIGSREKLGLRKTGFFHVQTWRHPSRGMVPGLVDPEGNLWFQLGLCAMGGGGDSYTLVANRADKFDWLPPKDGPFASAYIDGGGSFSFYAANWTRKFGQPFENEAFARQSIERVRKLGFNSSSAFSNFSRAEVAAKFPRVGWVPFDGMTMIPNCGNLFDPFAPEAATKMDANCAKLEGDNADSLLIGHFLGNEQPFEDVPRVVPTLDGTSAAKRHLVALLQARYGDIGKWNAAWEPKTPAKSFDELSDARLFVVTKAASDDVNAFFADYLDAYYKTVATAYRKHCPNHLLLGNRWLVSSANDDAVVRAAGRYLDVVSINYYTYGLDKAFLERAYTLSGQRPILLSEWHYGATDQGLSGGAREVKNQRERGLAYRNYVEQAASLGFVVGQQWFSYLDQPLTGRWFQGENGERGNIGLVNVTDRPYRDFLSVVAPTNFGVYDVLLGRKAPFSFDDPRFSDAKGGAKVALVAHATGKIVPGAPSNGWPGLPAERISKLVAGTNRDGQSPLSASYRLAWDETNLYLSVQVKDPTPLRNDQSGANLWQGDGVELFFGPEGIGQGGALRFGDRQLLLGAHRGDDGPRFYWNNAPEQVAIPMSVVPSGDGYTLEAAIPFKGLGFSPRDGQEIAFDIGFDDYTTGRRQLMWNGTERNSADRGAWGRARFVK